MSPSFDRGASANAQGAMPKSNESKASKKKKKATTKSKKNHDNNNNDTEKNSQNRNLVEELKLFQNTNLIHQQDPLEQLQQQLSQMIQEDETSTRIDARRRLLQLNISSGNEHNKRNLSLQQSQPPTQQQQQHMANLNPCTNGNHLQQTSLSSSTHINQQYGPPHDQNLQADNGLMAMTSSYDSGDSGITIKKGVVLYQPQSKRLFQRWKKRYIILTPNSLFLFKKSSAKVGRSEMGKFICKPVGRSHISTQNYFSKYQRYSAIEAKLNELVELDSRVKMDIIGKSSENRNLYLVKVSSDPSANKPVILFDAGHHAREWISHSTIMYILESLVNIDMPRLESRDCNTQRCRRATARRPSLDLNKFDYWFIPVVNPDGYEYSHTRDRLWRKTRSPGFCSGVDPNRIYPYHWRESGASGFACSEIFAGPKPLSEPEVRAVTSVMDNNNGRILAYLTLHAYSQVLLAPYGYGRVYPDNYEEMKVAAEAFMQSLKYLRETDYKFGVTAILLYPAAGGSDDYAHGAAGIRYSYTIELPDQGNKGFVLPASDIVPVAHETLIGLQSMIDSL